MRAPPRAVPRRRPRRLHPRQGRPGHRPVQAGPARRDVSPAAPRCRSGSRPRWPTPSSPTSAPRASSSSSSASTCACRCAASASPGRGPSPRPSAASCATRPPGPRRWRCSWVASGERTRTRAPHHPCQRHQPAPRHTHGVQGAAAARQPHLRRRHGRPADRAAALLAAAPARPHRGAARRAVRRSRGGDRRVRHLPRSCSATRSSAASGGPGGRPSPCSTLSVVLHAIKTEPAAAVISLVGLALLVRHRAQFRALGDPTTRWRAVRAFVVLLVVSVVSGGLVHLAQPARHRRRLPRPGRARAGARARAWSGATARSTFTQDRAADIVGSLLLGLGLMTLLTPGLPRPAPARAEAVADR